MCISVIGITEVSVKIFKLSDVEEIGAFLLFLLKFRRRLWSHKTVKNDGYM